MKISCRHLPEYVKIIASKLVVRAAQLFFLIQRNDSLIYGVVVVLVVVVSNSRIGSLKNNNGNWNDNVTNQTHDWLNEEKIFVLHVRHAFGAIFDEVDDDVNFSNLRLL